MIGVVLVVRYKLFTIDQVAAHWIELVVVVKKVLLVLILINLKLELLMNLPNVPFVIKYYLALINRAMIVLFAILLCTRNALVKLKLNVKLHINY